MRAALVQNDTVINIVMVPDEDAITALGLVSIPDNVEIGCTIDENGEFCPAISESTPNTIVTIYRLVFELHTQPQQYAIQALSKIAETLTYAQITTQDMTEIITIEGVDLAVDDLRLLANMNERSKTLTTVDLTAPNTIVFLEALGRLGVYGDSATSEIARITDNSETE